MSTSVIKKQTFPVLTLSENIEAPQSTNVTGSNTLTLSPGTWLINGFMDWNRSIDGVCNYSINVVGAKSQTIRSHGWNGGGISNTFIVAITSEKTVTQSAYQGWVTTATARARLTAVKLF